MMKRAILSTLFKKQAGLADGIIDSVTGREKS